MVKAKLLRADMLAIVPSQITDSQSVSMCTKTMTQMCRAQTCMLQEMPPLLTLDHITSPAYTYKQSKRVSHVHNCKCLPPINSCLASCNVLWSCRVACNKQLVLDTAGYDEKD